MGPKQRVSSSSAPLQTAVPVQIIKSSEIPPSPVNVIENVPVQSKKPAAKKTRKTVVAPEPVIEKIVTDEITTEEPETPAVDVVQENIEEEVVEEEEAVAPSEDKKRTRRLVSKDSLRTDFESLWTEYAEELSVKKRGGKKLSLEKYLHRLQGDAFKLLKIRPTGDDKKARSENTNSGFMKPVNISPELAEFINVSPTEPITRVLITKKICEYIKEKDLQNPKDRREIIPDKALKKLFELTDFEKTPLTYYSMQRKIQSHIFKTQSV